MSWKDDKNLGPWSFEPIENKLFCNLGDKIASYVDSRFDTDFTGVAIIPMPSGGYWHSMRNSLLAGELTRCTEDLDMAYDYDTSAETVARNSSVIIAITCFNKSLTWAVSGTGFTLGNKTTTGLTNTLNANGTACGSATITATDYDGNSVTGYVRCTTGQWVLIYDGPTGAEVCYVIAGKYKTQYSHACCKTPEQGGSPQCPGWTEGYAPCWTGALCGTLQGIQLTPYHIEGDIWEWQC